MRPDKIYVSRNFSEDNSPHGLWYLNKSEHDANVEYIRKDALLEWAKERKRYYEDEILRWGMSDSSQATTFVSIASMKRLVYEGVIDKLNSL